MFDWNDLRHLLAVAREGSTLRAAKALGISQPTVHRRLAVLEKSLGCTLVERHAGGYKLTEFGKELQQYAAGVEQAVEALQHHVISHGKVITGVVRVTCSTTIAGRLARARFLEMFLERHPGLRVELLATDRYLDLSKGEADVAIRGGEARDEALVGRKIAEFPWAIYASHSYVERRGSPNSLAELESHSIIEFVGEISEMTVARWLRERAPRAVISGQGSNIPSVLLAVKSGAGLAPLPAALGDHDSDLIRVLGPIAELGHPIYLLTHPDLRKMPRIRAFLEFCSDELRPVLTGIGPHNAELGAH
jgi:molybdate transport repressor ModE-like protein